MVTGPQKMTMAPPRPGRDVSPFAFPYDNSANLPTGVTTTITANGHWNDDFHTPKRLPADTSPSPRRYEIRRGVAHRVDSADTDDILAPPVREPPPRNPHRNNNGNIDRTTVAAWRPVSSLYSQSSPKEDHFAIVAAPDSYGSHAEDISPPSSPELAGHRDARHPDDDNVSPIDDVPNMSQLEIAKQHHRRYLEEQQRKQQQQQELEQMQRQPQHPSPSPQQRSQIPMMRRDRRKQQDSAGSHLRETRSKELMQSQPNQPTRWDDQTGRPIDDSSPSHQSQARTQPAPTQRNAMKAFGDRVRKMRPGGGDSNSGKSAISAPMTAPMSLDERPGWRGASGRQTFVQHVQDTPQVAPIHIPRKSSKRAAAQVARAGGVTSPLSPISPSESETSAAATTPTGPRVAPVSLDRPLPTPPAPTQDTALAYPTPPTSEGAVQPPIHAMPNLADQAGNASQQPGSLPFTPNRGPTEKAIRRKPPPTNPLALNPHNGHNSYASFSSSVYSPQFPPDSAEKPSPQPNPANTQSPEPASTTSDAWAQPASRFSVTTFATSANAGSPRASLDADLPPLPTPPAQSDSVMDRRRPLRMGNTSPAINADEPFKISMSPAYTTSPGPASPPTPTARQKLPSQIDRPAPRSSVTSGIFNGTNGRPESILSLSKALPPAPPEVSSANDRVGHLNARLSSLGNRRININMAIKQMTELMPTDNLLASEAVLRKREAEKRKVEALKIELADVQREEYELGLKLHRAYKRLDKDAEYEPTTLWVRRVTG
ncbi:hypothetical protein ACHAQH_008903 [Verticillium albo-atrum]